jgi:adenosylhomocysteine nucleosidase
MPASLQDRLRTRLSGLALPSVDSKVSGVATHQARLHFGTVVSGDTFVNDEVERIRLHRSFDAMAVEMEGAAVAQVAQRFGLPWLVVRCLSDLAGADSHLNFPAFLPHAARAAALVVRAAVAEMAG